MAHALIVTRVEGGGGCNNNGPGHYFRKYGSLKLPHDLYACQQQPRKIRYVLCPVHIIMAILSRYCFDRFALRARVWAVGHMSAATGDNWMRIAILLNWCFHVSAFSSCNMRVWGNQHPVNKAQETGQVDSGSSLAAGRFERKWKKLLLMVERWFVCALFICVLLSFFLLLA